MASNEITIGVKGGKLTAAGLASIERSGVPDGAQRIRVKDTEIRHLEFRLSSSGARAWAVSGRFNGIQRRFTIQGGARMGLADARKAALKILNDVQHEGRDPTQERRDLRAAELAKRAGIGEEWTLQKLVDEYGVLQAQPAKQRSWHLRKRHIERTFKPLLSLRVSAIPGGEILDIVDRKHAEGSSVTGLRALTYLRTCLRWAMDRKRITIDPTAGLPMKELRKTRNHKARERVLTPVELAALWGAWEAQPHNGYSKLMRLAVLTGQRRGELAVMTWGDLDLDRNEWRQPTNKADRPHLVPLSAEALAVIGPKPKSAKDGALVLTNTAGGPLAVWQRNIKLFGTAARKGEAAITGWTIHDLRRSAATMMAELGVDRGVIELLLNHSEAGGQGVVAQTYNRFSYEPQKREAVDRLARHVRGLVSGSGSKVIEFRPASAG